MNHAMNTPFLESCKFCQFIHGQLDEKRIIYQDELVLAFTELHPVAAFHILIIPKIHIQSVNDIAPGNSRYIGRVYEAAAKIAVEKNIGSYTLFTRTGTLAGQTISHLHHHMVSNFQDACIVGI